MCNIETFTIGHSNYSLQQFLILLCKHETEGLVDIRRFPSSRAFSYFHRDERSTALEELRIEYEWIKALKGRRPKQDDSASANNGLPKGGDGFRNYADDMLRGYFAKA